MADPMQRTPRLWPRWLSYVAALSVVFALFVLQQWRSSVVRPSWAWVAGIVALVWLLAALYRALTLGEARASALRALLLGVAGATAITLALGGWWTRVIGQGTPPFNGRAPGAAIDVRDPGQRAALLAYARTLDFDSLTHRASDDRYLTIKDTVTVDTIVNAQGKVIFHPLPPDSQVRRWAGPRAKIAPERRAYLNSRADLGPGQGRVVARIWIDPAYRAPNGSAGYQPLRLPPGVSYLWIDSLQMRGRDTLGVARAVIIPEDPTYGVRTDSLVYHSHRNIWEAYSTAVWRFSFRNDPACYNVTCPWGCCDNCGQE